MPVNVRKITLWRAEVDNKPGMLADTLGPLAEAEVDLHVVMGYRHPGHEKKATIEVAPITRKAANPCPLFTFARVLGYFHCGRIEIPRRLIRQARPC